MYAVLTLKNQYCVVTNNIVRLNIVFMLHLQHIIIIKEL